MGQFPDGEIHLIFAFILGENPTYSYIENCNWISDLPYGTMHRIASDGKVKDVVMTAVEYCADIISNIRIDTHENNKTMQHVLDKLGFVSKRYGEKITSDESYEDSYSGIKYYNSLLNLSYIGFVIDLVLCMFNLWLVTGMEWKNFYFFKVTFDTFFILFACVFVSFLSMTKSI